MDTLAYVSLISEDKRKELALKLSTNKIKIRGVGEVKLVNLTEEVGITLNKKKLRVRFAVLDYVPFDCVVGLDVLTKLPEFIKFGREFSTTEVMAIKKEEVSLWFKNEKVNQEEVAAAFEILVEKIANLAEFEKKSVLEMFEQNCVIWTRQAGGCFIDTKVRIEVKGQPIKCKLRLMSPNKRIILQKLLDELLDRKMIRPSHSEWASPLHLVLKSDRVNWQLVCDYRSLNKRTVRDSYPIPRMMDLLYELAGKQYYSCIDLEMGFFNLKLKEESKKYTAFNCHLGLFEWNVMPMGFTNAPAEF